jgi:hypothetical protein
MTTSQTEAAIRSGNFPPYLILPLANTILEAVKLIFSRPNRKLSQRVEELERIVEQQQVAIAELVNAVK